MASGKPAVFQSTHRSSRQHGSDKQGGEVACLSVQLLRYEFVHTLTGRPNLDDTIVHLEGS